MFVDAKCPKVGVKQQLLRINVNRRLSLALRTDVPLGVDEAPEVWSCTPSTSDIISERNVQNKLLMGSDAQQA